MNKKIILISLMIFILLILIFFFVITNKKANDKPLTICWWGTTLRDERTEKVIELYQQLHNNKEIEFKTFSWHDYWPFIDKISSGEESCDIIQEDYAYLNRDVKNGTIIELDPFIENGIIDVSNIPSAFLDSGRIDNKIYGINLGTNAPSVIYDPAILEKAGIEKPDINWTWDELIDFSIVIFETTGVKTLPFFSGGSDMTFLNILKQNGYSLYSKDGKSLGFNQTDILVYYFELQLRLKKAGALSDVYKKYIQENQNGIEEFLQGRSWIFYIWSNSYPAFCTLLDHPVELFLFPRIQNPRQAGTYLKPSQFFSITSNSDNQNESAEFINFFINNPDANNILLGERGVPVNTEIKLIVRENVSSSLKPVFDYISLVADGNSSDIDPPDPPKSDLVKKLLLEISVNIIDEDITALEGAEQFLKKANLILAE